MTVKDFYDYCCKYGLLDYDMLRETTDGLGNTIDMTDLTLGFVDFDEVHKTVFISDYEY